MVISVLVFALTGWSGQWYVRLPLRLALLPVVAAVSYETLMLLAKWENWFMKALRWPGMLLQRMTTREPDLPMLEVAIAAFAACLDDEERKTVLPEPLEVAVVVEEPEGFLPPPLCEAAEEAAGEPSPDGANAGEDAAAQ